MNKRNNINYFWKTSIFVTIRIEKIIKLYIKNHVGKNNAKHMNNHKNGAKKGTIIHEQTENRGPTIDAKIDGGKMQVRIVFVSKFVDLSAPQFVA